MPTSPLPSKHAAINPWQLLLLILMLGVTMRCVGITQPFTDTWSWRQGDVAMIAEHFYKGGYHLSYPEVNWGGAPQGEMRGYVGTEWPIMPWLAAVIYQVTGEHEWVGRGLSVLAWAAGLPALFIYGRRLVNDRVALFACLLYTLMPLSVYTGRSFMPDVPSLSAAMWGLALFDLWLGRRGNWWLVLGTILAIALAILIKPPSIMVGFAMVVRALQRCGWRIVLDPRLWLMAVVPMGPAVLWFKHAAWLGHTFWPHHFFGAEGLQHEQLPFYLDKLEKMVAWGFTPVATLAGVLGMIVGRRDRRLWPMYAWVIGWAAFFVIAGHGNRHPWYQLPLAPPLAMFGAVLLVWLYVNIKPAHLVLGATACFSILAAILVTSVIPINIPVSTTGSLGRMFKVEEKHKGSGEGLIPLTGGLFVYSRDASLPAMIAGRAVDQDTPADAVILAANSGDPVIFYYAHRYGWLFPREKETGLWNGMPESYNGGSPTDWITNAALIGEIEQRRREGVQFFIITRDDSWWLTYYTDVAKHMEQYRVVKQTEAYILFDLRTRIGE